MTKNELDDSLKAYFDEEYTFGVCVYCQLKKNEGIRKIDIEGGALAELGRLFLDSIKEKIYDNEELSVLDFSNSDERRNVIYNLDTDLPDDLLAMQAIRETDEVEQLNIAQHDLSQIAAIIVEIGDSEQQIFIYKTMAPVNIFLQKSFFLYKSNERFEKLKEEFFRISTNFQILDIDGKILVYDLKAIERFFGFYQAIKNEAKKSVDAIAQAEFLANPEALQELVDSDDVSFSRKLMRVASHSPVLQQKVPAKEIIKFCGSYPGLKGRIRFNESESKIVLDTKVSKDLFVKLMMDDLLTSELTRRHYESIAKDYTEGE